MVGGTGSGDRHGFFDFDGSKAKNMKGQKFIYEQLTVHFERRLLLKQLLGGGSSSGSDSGNFLGLDSTGACWLVSLLNSGLELDMTV